MYDFMSRYTYVRYISHIIKLLLRLVIKTKVVVFLSDEGPTLKTFDFTIRIGSTRTFLYFDL